MKAHVTKFLDIRSDVQAISVKAMAKEIRLKIYDNDGLLIQACMTEHDAMALMQAIEDAVKDKIDG